MSEQQNIQTVKDAYAAFERGDVPAILAMLTDDVGWEMPGPAEIPYAGYVAEKTERLNFSGAWRGPTKFSSSSHVNFSPTATPWLFWDVTRRACALPERSQKATGSTRLNSVMEKSLGGVSSTTAPNMPTRIAERRG